MADKAEDGKTEEHSSWTLPVDTFPLNDHFNESYCDGLNFTFCLNHSSFNYTTTYLNATEPSVHSFDIFMGVVSIVLGFMILITVIGNVFVIAAILLERNLQNVANYLIVSLAVADLMVACLVMPLGAVYEIMKGWVLGPELCDMWTSCDVLCCTASILHLVAIAVDRYWAVTDLDYIHTRNVNKIGMMIIVVWTVALVVSLAPQFGWKDPDYLDRINSQKRCLVSQDVAYQIFATCSTFYVPLLVILILYWKIFQTARKRIRKNQKLKSPVVSTKSSSNRNLIIARNFLPKRRFKNFKRNSKQNSATKALVSSLLMTEGQSTATVDAMFPDDATESRKNSDAVPEPEPETANSNELKFDDQNLPSGRPEVTTAFTISMRSDIDDILNTGSSDNVSPEKSSGGATNDGSHQSHMSDMSRLEMLRSDVVGGSGKSCGIINVAPGISNYGTAEAIVKAVNPMQIHREKKESLEAKRERKAAKTLAIITGAFVICWLPFFIMAILMPLFGPISDHLASFFLWLGYFNSTLNPVIYTVFSPEFRQAFKRILCGAPRRNSYYRSGTWR